MASFDSSSTFQSFHSFLPGILSVLPSEWRGTTFKNSNLLGREEFSKRLLSLIQLKKNEQEQEIENHSQIDSQIDSKGVITTNDLISLGNAEDYLRVSSNISCILESYLACKYSMNISQIFTFASNNLSILSVILTSETKVHLFIDENIPSPFNLQHLELIKLFSNNFIIHHSFPTLQEPNDIILSTEFSTSNVFELDFIDGIIGNSTLYIRNISRIIPSKILVIRKRLGTPMTTPKAEQLLRQYANLLPSESFTYTVDELNEFLVHLQVLSGTEINLSSLPQCYIAGLPALCSLWITLISQGGANVVMASTAYGGSSELVDIITKKSLLFKKHTFDITGNNIVLNAIQSTLSTLIEQHTQQDSEPLLPYTVVFVEIPTNPDMKVPPIRELAELTSNYQIKTGKKVMLLIDTTFAPGSRILSSIEHAYPNLIFMVFISMSKSVSRGLTTAGTLVSSVSEESRRLLELIRITNQLFDTAAKEDQLKRLIANHKGVEERCFNAYQVARYFGTLLQNTVKEYCEGYEMLLAFVTEEQALQEGYTTSTFSFNLPSIAFSKHFKQQATENIEETEEIKEQRIYEINTKLAQHFVDLLCEDMTIIKPCVSFGQDNSLIYATVPATSTQGAIKLEDKEKQAVGGVQLTRLSFPPSINMERVEELIKQSLNKCYEENWWEE